MRVHTHCHQKRDDVIKLILHLAQHMGFSAPCIQVYWINKFPHSPGSLSSLEGEWRWLLWGTPNSSCHPHCWVPPGDNSVQGQLNPSGSNSSFFGPSFVHENISKGGSTSPSGPDWKDGGSWVAVSGKIAKGVIEDSYCCLARMEKSWGRIVLRQPWAEIPWAQAISQLRLTLCTFLLWLHSAPLATRKHLHEKGKAATQGNAEFDPGSPRDNSSRHSYPVVMFKRTLHSPWGEHSEEDKIAKQSQ